MRILLLCLALLVAGSARAAEVVRVVSSIPDLADFARQIGGERVEARSLLNGSQDVHTFDPRVSDVKALAGARVFLVVGLGLEEWARGLVQNARNGGLLVVETARGASLLEEDDAGDRHGGANPHVWLDPANAAVMCRNIAEAFEAVDPQAKGLYRRRAAAYVRKLEASAARLKGEVASLHDRRFLSYHPAWPYFARAFGFQIAGVVSENPGQEPSARTLAGLIERINRERLRVLVAEPQLSSKLPALLAQETHLATVVLSDMVVAPDRTYLEHMERNVRTLVAALGGAR